VTGSPARAERGVTNGPVELARYTISAGERMILGQRVLGVVRLTDIPADGAAAATSSRSRSQARPVRTVGRQAPRCASLREP
jgi:hypothetical protein